MLDSTAVPAPAAGAKGAIRIEEPERSQRALARRAAEARATVPDLDLSVDVALDAALEATPDADVVAILVRACALALRRVPRANGSYRDGRFELYSRVNVGVVLEDGDNYVVPTLFDADTKSVAQLQEELVRLRERIASGELAAPELAGATFTLWHPGALGITSATPVVIPPQAAAVAAGAVRELPVVRDGAIVPGHALTLTLACDHRILYGARAAEFLTAIQSVLEEAAL